MKKIVFVIFMAVMLIASIGYARDDELCLWVWSTDIAGATSDPPDSVWCKNPNNSVYYSKGATYVQGGLGAKSIDVTWDTASADGATTIASLISGGDTTVICSNANIIELNILSSANNSQFSEGGVYYHAETGLADADANTFGLTPTPNFKLTVTDTDNVGIGCAVAWTLVHWK